MRRASLRHIDVWRDTAPTVCITLQLEGEPRVYVSASHEGQETRLADWIGRHLDEILPAVDLAISRWLDTQRMRDAA